MVHKNNNDSRFMKPEYTYLISLSSIPSCKKKTELTYHINQIIFHSFYG